MTRTIGATNFKYNDSVIIRVYGSGKCLCFGK